MFNVGTVLDLRRARGLDCLPRPGRLVRRAFFALTVEVVPL